MAVCKRCNKTTKGNFAYCSSCNAYRKKEAFQTYGRHKCQKCFGVASHRDGRIVVKKLREVNRKAKTKVKSKTCFKS